MEGLRKVKALVKLNLERNVEGKKRSFSKYLNSKGKMRENMDPLLKEERDLVTKDMEQAEVQNAFLASVFTGKICLQEPLRHQWEGLEKRGFTPGRRWPSWGTPKQTKYTQVDGIWQNVPTSAEGAGQCHCEVTVDNLWKVLETGRGSWQK